MHIRNCRECIKFINCFHEKKNELLKKYPGVSNKDVVTYLKVCKNYDNGTK